MSSKFTQQIKPNLVFNGCVNQNQFFITLPNATNDCQCSQHQQNINMLRIQTPYLADQILGSKQKVNQNQNQYFNEQQNRTKSLSKQSFRSSKRNKRRGIKLTKCYTSNLSTSLKSKNEQFSPKFQKKVSVEHEKKHYEFQENDKKQTRNLVGRKMKQSTETQYQLDEIAHQKNQRLAGFGLSSFNTLHSVNSLSQSVQKKQFIAKQRRSPTVYFSYGKINQQGFLREKEYSQGKNSLDIMLEQQKIQKNQQKDIKLNEYSKNQEKNEFTKNISKDKHGSLSKKKQTKRLNLKGLKIKQTHLKKQYSVLDQNNQQLFLTPSQNILHIKEYHSLQKLPLLSSSQLFKQKNCKPIQVRRAKQQLAFNPKKNKIKGNFLPKHSKLKISHEKQSEQVSRSKLRQNKQLQSNSKLSGQELTNLIYGNNKQLENKYLLNNRESEKLKFILGYKNKSFKDLFVKQSRSYNQDYYQ